MVETRKGRGLTRYNWLLEHVTYEGDGCLIWPFGVTDGYPSCAAPEGGSRRAHRLMCKLASGEPPTTRHQAAHSCGVSNCVHPKHLSWKTNGENQLDRRRHGTAIKKGRAKRSLTVEQVAIILANPEKLSLAKLARRFGVCKATVWHVANGKTWKGGKPGHSGFKPGDPRNPFKRAA